MRAPAAEENNLYNRREARQLDLWIFAGAAIAGMASWLARGSLGGAVLLVAVSALTTIALFRPWSRRMARRSIETATWAVEREREHAVAAAAQLAETWRAILDTATEAIVTIDANGIIETVNGAAVELFGYQPVELIGKNVNRLMPQPYQREHDSYLEHYLRTGERRIIGIGREVVALRKDGTEVPIDLSVGEGTIEGRPFFTAVLRDITDRKELQTKLAQAERLAAVGELAAGVAHEINNPINTMINCAQLIHDGDDAKSNSQVIVEEGERIADIVRDLLQFARDDRALAQPTSILETAQRTQRLIGENWKRHGITLTIEIAEDLPAVHARPQQIQQVLLNLLINAKDALLQHGKGDRRVEMTACADGTGIAFTVTDNGPGIEPDVANRIFEPFVTTKRARGGTGLGLSISRSIVESYNGTLSVKSVPGEGSSFTVWLPCEADDAADAGSSPG